MADEKTSKLNLTKEQIEAGIRAATSKFLADPAGATITRGDGTVEKLDSAGNVVPASKDTGI